MLSYDSVLTAFLDAGLPRTACIDALENAQALSSEQLKNGFGEVLQDLYYSATTLKYMPDENMLFSESQACEILGIGRSSFSVARSTGKLTPNATRCGAMYRYSLPDLAEFKIKKDSYKYKQAKS